MPRHAGGLKQAVRGHGRCCQGASVTKKDVKTPENGCTNFQATSKSQKLPHTLESVTSVSLYPSLVFSAFSLTDRFSIAITTDADAPLRFRQRHGARKIASLSLCVVNAAAARHISRFKNLSAVLIRWEATACTSRVKLARRHLQFYNGFSRRNNVVARAVSFVGARYRSS